MSEQVPRRRALVIEDDGAVRELLVETLELRGIDVESVDSADEALRLLENDMRPDLIVLDRRMPGMSGDDLLTRLKSSPRWSKIPVAVVSGVSRREHEMSAKPEVYLEKPFDIDTFDEALRDMGAVG
jgi:two-component system, NtrC family, response regulator AtoC